jgi:sulfite exporter TauE/SafE/copper chaperone CopZ
MDKQTLECEFNVQGMHCAACELVVEKTLSKIRGVQKVDAKLNNTTVEVTFAEITDHSDFIREANLRLDGTGYSLNTEAAEVDTSRARELVIGLGLALVIVSLFLILQRSSFAGNLLSATNEGSLITPFIVGIVASLSTCMAVVGGVVLSLSGRYSQQGQRMPIIQFHISRLVSFFILGGVLGLVGSSLNLTDNGVALINIVLFFMMLIIGLNLLGVGKHTNKLQLRLPKSVGRNVLKLQESQHAIVPIVIGAATFILPCGFTQAMQVQAFGTGSFVSGALTMFIFALGTLPVLGLLSFVSINFSNNKYSGLFFKTAGFLVLGFAIFSLLSALAVFQIIPPTNTFLGI